MHSPGSTGPLSSVDSPLEEPVGSVVPVLVLVLSELLLLSVVGCGPVEVLPPGSLVPTVAPVVGSTGPVDVVLPGLVLVVDGSWTTSSLQAGIRRASGTSQVKRMRSASPIRPAVSTPRP
jgi:hypothetical protein